MIYHRKGEIFRHAEEDCTAQDSLSRYFIQMVFSDDDKDDPIVPYRNKQTRNQPTSTVLSRGRACEEHCFP